MEILERVYFHNTVLDYLIALAIILVGLAFVRVLRNSILGRLKKWSARTSATGDDFVLTSIERFGIPALYYFIIYAGLN